MAFTFQRTQYSPFNPAVKARHDSVRGSDRHDEDRMIPVSVSAENISKRLIADDHTVFFFRSMPLTAL